MSIERHITVKPVDDGAVVFDARAGEYTQLNQTARVVLERAADGAPSNEIAAALSERFDVSTERATADVEECLTLFAAKGWLGERR